jgi:hypothetical protein
LQGRLYATAQSLHITDVTGQWRDSMLRNGSVHIAPTLPKRMVIHAQNTGPARDLLAFAPTQTIVRSADTTGTASSSITLTVPLPLRAPTTMQLQADAHIRALRTRLSLANTPLLPITADPLSLRLQDNTLHVEGTVRVRGITLPTQLRVQLPPLFGAQHDATLPHSTLRTHVPATVLQALPPWLAKPSTTTGIPVSIQSHPKTLATADIRALAFPWLAPPYAPNSITLSSSTLHAKAGATPYTIHCTGDSPALTIANPDGTLWWHNTTQRLQSWLLPKVRLGRGVFRLEGTTSTEGITVALTGESLDLAPLILDALTQENQTPPSLPVQLRIAVDTLYGKQPITWENVQGSMNCSPPHGCTTATLRATHQGTGNVLAYTAYTDANIRPAIRHFTLHTDAASAALHSLGIAKSLRDGRLTVEGTTTITPGTPGTPGIPAATRTHATITLEDFGAKDMPVLAKLFALVSLPGMTEALGSQKGMRFDRFSATITQSGNMVTVTNGRAHGPRMVLTVEGTLDLTAKQWHLQGQVSPVAVLKGMWNINTLPTVIPLLGNVLFGKNTSGIAGFTYKVDGPLETPVVRVNPLSVLAPGRLKEWLFMAPPPVAQQ